jgi:hypothetical protein
LPLPLLSPSMLKKSGVRGDVIRGVAEANGVWSVVNTPSVKTNARLVAIANTFIFIVTTYLIRTFIISDMKNNSTFSYFHFRINKTIRRFNITCLTKKIIIFLIALLRWCGLQENEDYSLPSDKLSIHLTYFRIPIVKAHAAPVVPMPLQNA